MYGHKLNTNLSIKASLPYNVRHLTNEKDARHSLLQYNYQEKDNNEKWKAIQLLKIAAWLLNNIL